MAAKSATVATAVVWVSAIRLFVCFVLVSSTYILAKNEWECDTRFDFTNIYSQRKIVVNASELNGLITEIYNEKIYDLSAVSSGKANNKGLQVMIYACACMKRAVPVVKMILRIP